MASASLPPLSAHHVGFPGPAAASIAAAAVPVLAAAVGEARALQERPRVFVLACGRLEALPVESLTLDEVRRATRRAFDLPAEQQFALVDKDGVQVASDSALRALVTHAETVSVRLSDNALHDFERRIDQLQHMQVGFLCDQLATFRQEYADVRAELKALRLAMEQEHAARELGDGAVRREMDDLRDLAHRQREMGDEKIEALETAIFDVRHAIHNEALAREQVALDCQRRVQELRDVILTEGKAREHGDERLRLEADELRRALQLEAADREDAEVRAERALHDLREALSDASEAHVAEAGDIRRQLVDTKQAVALEQRERIAADTDLAAALRELRGSLQDGARERTGEEARVAARCAEMETTLEAERLARQSAITELTQQLAVVVESAQEEQQLRSAADAEFAQSLEALRRRHELVERRVEEDTRSRREQDSKLSRTVAALQEAVASAQDRGARDARELGERLEACISNVEAEQKERIGAFEELSARLLQQRRQISDIIGSESSSAEFRQQLDRERKARADLARDVEVLQDATRRSAEELTARLRNECLDVVHGDLGALREGLEKVVEAVQQERRARGDADAKLREDCREALQKEIASRLERDARVQADMDAEAHARQEAVEVIHLAMEELRHGLETHTHEDVDSDEDEEENDEHRGA